MFQEQFGRSSGALSKYSAVYLILIKLYFTILDYGTFPSNGRVLQFPQQTFQSNDYRPMKTRHIILNDFYRYRLL